MRLVWVFVACMFVVLTVEPVMHQRTCTSQGGGWVVVNDGQATGGNGHLKSHSFDPALVAGFS